MKNLYARIILWCFFLTSYSGALPAMQEETFSFQPQEQNAPDIIDHFMNLSGNNLF
jgi:hypothetical protein